jgi:hypothetical protein
VHIVSILKQLYRIAALNLSVRGRTELANLELLRGFFLRGFFLREEAYT